MSKKFYTSDFHLFHDRIIEYCDRPFDDVFQMHDAIVKNINEKVAPNDELFILGDVSFYGGEKVRAILEQIHGRKHLLIGNHDAHNIGDWEGWKSVNHYLEIKDRGRRVVLMHYPIESWHGQNHGWIHLHGHRHGVSGRYYGRPAQRGIRVDVGVDPWDFQPVSLNEILSHLESIGEIEPRD